MARPPVLGDHMERGCGLPDGGCGPAVPPGERGSLTPSVLRPRWSGRRSGTRGGSALEFMLVLPIILLVLVGMLALSTFLSTRYFLTAGAIHAARFCTVNRQPTKQCVDAAIASYLPPAVVGRCSTLTTGVQRVLLPGTSTEVFVVSLDCTYHAPIGGNMLDTQGIRLTRLQARGTMPIPAGVR